MLHSSLHRVLKICTPMGRRWGNVVNVDEIKSRMDRRPTWGKVCLSIEAHSAILLSRHQDLISNLHVQSFWIQADD